MSLPECITWMTVGLAESVAIVTLNLCTIIVFIRNRNLRKRCTYLVIHLAVVDMLAGGCALYGWFYSSGVACNVWKWHPIVHLPEYILITLFLLFPGMSLINITIIALERVHATFRPLRHRVLKKWMYGVLIAKVWVTTGLGLITSALLEHFEGVDYNLYLRIAGGLFFLLIICVSYSSILIKFRRGAQPQHHAAASRERKLTMTLLIVTVVSLLLNLPAATFAFLVYSGKFEMSFSVGTNLRNTLWVLVYANSLVNPILYAIRMPEYRSAVVALVLFRKQPTLRNRKRRVAVLPLRDM